MTAAPLYLGLLLAPWHEDTPPRSTDLAALDPPTDLKQFLANRGRPFLQNGWQDAPLPNHRYDSDEPFCKRLVYKVMLTDRIHVQ